MSTPQTSPVRKHASPPLGLVAVAFVILFCAGLYPVTAFGGKPYFPGPWEPLSTIVAFFQARPSAVVWCALLQFGSAVPLGIFTASAVSRFRFLGVSAAGPNIALFGGFACAFMVMSSSAVMWCMVHPAVAQDTSLISALYYLAYALGGPGYSVSFGLLMAGVSVPALFYRLLPRWGVGLGLLLAICGEASWLNLKFPALLFLVPLTRFPGFIWMVAAGFLLPTTVSRETEAVQQ